MIRFSLLVLLSVSALFAQIQFPHGSGVVDITKPPYNAKSDGKSDVTEIIQQALDDHANGDYIIYLPNGIYRISRQLSWPQADKEEDSYRRTILQGESMGGTHLIMSDNAYGFDNPDAPRAMLYTGMGNYAHNRNAIRDLTLHTGKGNPGIIGVRFNANYQGTLLNLKIFADDGNGVAGIDMNYTDNIGPLFVKNVEIHGFDVGILTGFPMYGMTFEHITLFGQKKYGIENHDQVLTIRNLRSHNAVPAVVNYGENALLTMIGGALEYTGKKKAKFAAIYNEGFLFARDIATSRYAKAIDDRGPASGDGVEGSEIIEYSSDLPTNLCHSPLYSFKLLAAETLVPMEQSADQWVGIQGDYGGTQGTGSDDSKAIQQAIDDGAETIYFPPGGRYTINKDIHVRNRVRRLIGTEATIDGTGKFIIEGSAFKEITIERFGEFGAGILHKSPQTLILKNIKIKDYESEKGAGDLYIEDANINHIVINYQRVWARSLYMDNDRKTKIENNGGTLWVLGLTANNGNTVLHNRAHGEAELIGVHVISNRKAKYSPMFVNDSASISVEGLRETLIQGNAFPKIAEETRNGSTKTLTSEDLLKNPSGGTMMTLFVGYIPKVGSNEPPEVEGGSDLILLQNDIVKLSGKVYDDGRGAKGYCKDPVQWKKLSGPGRVVFSNEKDYETDVSFSYSGRYNITFTADDGEFKASDTSRIYVFDLRTSTRDHSGNGVASGRGMDTWISEFDSYTPHGDDSLLQIGYSKEGASAKVYLKFDISAVPGPVSDAALQLFMPPDPRYKNKKKPVEWNVFGLLEEPGKDFGDGMAPVDWQETELTWYSAPANQDGPGGAFVQRKNRGGGIDPRYTTFLGTIKPNPDSPFGTFIKTSSLTDFMKRKHKSQLYTFILTAVAPSDSSYFIYSRDAGKALAPVLYISYFDSNRTVSGAVTESAIQLSKVNINIVSLDCNFDLTIGEPQFVKIEIFNEAGKFIQQICGRELESEKKYTFTFKAKNYPTGKYTLKVSGESFSKEEKFYILN
ncbi:MAG: glycosyl hydrolase family 28-related protein [Hallerella porci]|uniref:glycosyl hydrolase family 28-related protein n=1 Tax=Hallerella TaxID=2815788 RepID=UPI000D084F26|nr:MULTISPECIES: glycosyl hydrolase family 28-related protein [Hallerella]MCI5600221.1 DNRLRE domain-containing protein [Hallerella sp.]MDY3922336.1 glycosyl hydrolase family 28-related protein [Hallerella porci]